MNLLDLTLLNILDLIKTLTITNLNKVKEISQRIMKGRNIFHRKRKIMRAWECRQCLLKMMHKICYNLCQAASILQAIKAAMIT
jgi:hypothetical protein